MILVGEGNELFDFGLGFLESVLESLDHLLEPIHKEIESASIWEVENHCDHGEYLIGVGFCVMQRYFLDVLQDMRVDQRHAREQGPKTTKGVPIARVIHAAANYWKHEPEWHIWLEELGERSQKTIEQTLHGRDSDWYPLSELLSDLCGENKLLLVNCIPHLKQWREAVYKISKS